MVWDNIHNYLSCMVTVSRAVYTDHAACSGNPLETCNLSGKHVCAGGQECMAVELEERLLYTGLARIM